MARAIGADRLRPLPLGAVRAQVVAFIPAKRRLKTAV